MINQDKQINDADDYVGYAIDIWEAFLQSFTKETGLIRDIEEDDTVDESWTFVYSDRGQRLALRMRDRLTKLGEKLFPESEFEIEIESHLYREY